MYNKFKDTMEESVPILKVRTLASTFSVKHASHADSDYSDTVMPRTINEMMETLFTNTDLAARALH